MIALGVPATLAEGCAVGRVGNSSNGHKAPEFATAQTHHCSVQRRHQVQAARTAPPIKGVADLGCSTVTLHAGADDRTRRAAGALAVIVYYGPYIEPKRGTEGNAGLDGWHCRQCRLREPQASPPDRTGTVSCGSRRGLRVGERRSRKTCNRTADDQIGGTTDL